jgi:flagellar basal-body rod modification protein FlgD
MPVNSVSQATNTINAGIGTLASNYETFLSLLTTQLKNQDPLSPLDNNEFTQQLTAMTGVQQQLLTNQLLTQLLGESQASLGASAINMIGKTVTMINDQAMLNEDGATWTYKLDAAAAQTKLEVLNNSGQVVWTGFAASNAKGENTFAWDGKTLAGGSLPIGQPYSLRITAVDAGGAAIAATPLVTGVATRLETLNGQTVLTVNGVKAPLTDLTAVEIAPS